ncbi:ABC transporter permease [Sandaracinobacteroides saxicola]|uniref:Transport permease protein n=1 Tax=Sandaracinobacteroides saxicola TaxID=2759707 RepID=A0A7G5IIU1_9SPHN|nr:ABC transporter permease [Sandaracinobacteroides saxicola]QMW23283.1 ABC transporter permease [Sandaracinobacteroides saxicola]
MNPGRLSALLLFDVKACLRDRMAMGFLLAFPLLLYVFFAAMFGATDSPEAGARYYDRYTPGFAAAVLLNIAFLNLGPGIAIAKDAGMLRRLMITPATPVELWLASIARTLLVFAVGYALILFAGLVLFGQVPRASLPNLLLPALLAAFALLSCGFLLGALFSKPAAAFNAGMLLIQPMLLLSGAGMPLESMPRFAQWAAQLLPFTYVVEAMRLGWEGRFLTTDALLPSIILVVIGAAAGSLAAHLFRRGVA